MINGLRVYTNTRGGGWDADGGVFYSRRARGPFYRWLCEGEPGVWRCSRVRLSVLSIRALRVESLKSVPAALRAKLGEHYLE